MQETLAELDLAHSHDIKVIVSEWMPHQGMNVGNDGAKWDFDYVKQSDGLVEGFMEKLDGIGVQSYSVGAIRGGIKNMEEHWKRPFYYSEFNGKGPWNFKKTDWGVALDETTPARLQDLKLAYDAIEASSLCLGSTIFLWGYFDLNRPTYLSLLLPDDPQVYTAKTAKSDLLLTPRAEYAVEDQHQDG